MKLQLYYIFVDKFFKNYDEELKKICFEIGAEFIGREYEPRKYSILATLEHIKFIREKIMWVKDVRNKTDNIDMNQIYLEENEENM